MKTEVKLAEEKDVQQYVEWSCNTPLNLFDPQIAHYPSLRTLAVEQDGKMVLYAPFHPVFVVESLAHKPGITPRENAIALRHLEDSLEALARIYGVAEIWWQCADESLIDFACRHGYTKVETAVLKKRVEMPISAT